jgi:hypothetical protein
MADSGLTKPYEVVSTETPAEVLYEQAMDATDEQHAISIWQGLHLYPKAIGWAAYFSLGIIMYVYFPTSFYSNVSVRGSLTELT